MLFKVTVACWYEGPLHKRPRREWARIMLDAPDRDTAGAQGVAFAEGNAACDKRWLRFEWREISTVVLPKAIESL